jgi:hypothetical protein
MHRISIIPIEQVIFWVRIVVMPSAHGSDGFDLEDERVDKQHTAFVDWTELRARIRPRRPQEWHGMKINVDDEGERL